MHKILLTVVTASLMATSSLAGQTDASTPLLQVNVPKKARPIPEPLASGQEPGFKIRGTKGWAWAPGQYLEEIPWLVKFKMNFLMNCYVSMFTTSHPWVNEWWKPLPDAKKAAYANVIRSCQSNGITFCFAMNPQLASRRPLDPTNNEDIDLLFQHYAWAQSLGVHWFSICVDDVKWGNQGPAAIAAEDAGMVNTVLGRLREKDPGAQMIFCPGPYSGDGTPPEAHAYLQTLGREMNPDVYVFWTGDGVVTHNITVAAATSYKNAVNHRIVLWDNYPVNDGAPTLSLGPVSGRAPELCELIDGYMGNPMEPQNQINRIPLATCADYAYNPRAYDPGRSIGQAILLFGKSRAQRQTLKEVVETYPGFIVTGGGTGTNPVRDKFKKLAAEPHPHAAARQFVDGVEKLSVRLTKEFPGEFDDAKETVAADVAWMNQQLGSRK